MVEACREGARKHVGSSDNDDVWRGRGICLVGQESSQLRRASGRGSDKRTGLVVVAPGSEEMQTTAGWARAKKAEAFVKGVCIVKSQSSTWPCT